MKTKEQASKWFSSKSYLEQHKLSDKYFESKNPSLLTIEQVEEIWRKETQLNVTEVVQDLKIGLDKAIQKSNPLFSNYKPNHKQLNNKKMKTKETSTREQSLAWWKQLNISSQDSFSLQYTGRLNSESVIPLTSREIEEIWRNEVQIPELRNAEHNAEYLEKPNQKQFKQANPKLVNAYFKKFSKEDLYKVHLPLLISLLNPLDYNKFILNQQFKQLDESLFQAYIDKFSDEDLHKALILIGEKLCSSGYIKDFRYSQKK